MMGLLTSAQTSKTQPRAAVPHGPQLFEIGMTDAELYARVGEPRAYFCTKTQRYLTPEEFSRVVGADICRPVYDRSTEKNEYEVMIFFEVDASESRLHPTARVKEIRFTFDHNMSAVDAIKDIAETRQLCRDSCMFSVFAEMNLIATPGAGTSKLLFTPADLGTRPTKATPMQIMSILPL